MLMVIRIGQPRPIWRAMRIPWCIDEHAAPYQHIHSSAASKRSFRISSRAADHDRAFHTGILNDLAKRRFQRLRHDVDTSLHVRVLRGDRFKRLLGAEQCNTAARNDAFFNGSARGVQSVVNAVLAFLHFNFGGTTDADNGNTASQFGQTLLQLFTVVVRGRVFDLRLDLGNPPRDVGLLAGAVDDRGVFLVDANPLGAPACRGQHSQA